MLRKKKRLGEILLERGLVTAEQLRTAVAEQARTKEFLGTILLKRKFISEKGLLAAFSDQFSMAVVDLKSRYIDWKMVRQYSSFLVLDHHCFPIEQDETTVTMAVTNPLDVWTLRKAEDEAGAKGLRLRFVLTSEEDVKDAIKRYRMYVQRTLPS